MAAEKPDFDTEEYKKILDADYVNRLDAFRASGQVTQPQEVSNRAARMVAESIRLYPQNNDGAQWIAAVSALRYEFYPEPGPVRDDLASMLELARMVPDVEMCGQEMTKAHTGYQVVERPKPDEPPKPLGRPNISPARATRFVSQFAFHTLGVIQMVTVMFMKDRGLPLNGANLRLRLDNAVAIGPWEVNLAVVQSVHDAISANEDLRLEVYKHIAGIASTYIEGSLDQQAKHSPVAAKRLASIAANEVRGGRPPKRLKQ